MSKLLMISKRFKTYDELHKYLTDNNLMDHTKTRYVIKITGNQDMLQLEYRETGLFKSLSEGIDRIESTLATFTRVKGGLRHSKIDPMLRPLMKAEKRTIPEYQNKEYLGALTRTASPIKRRKDVYPSDKIVAADL